jgi:hypothetical protein
MHSEPRDGLRITTVLAQAYVIETLVDGVVINQSVTLDRRQAENARVFEREMQEIVTND